MVLVCLQMTQSDVTDKIEGTVQLPTIVFAHNASEGETTSFAVAGRMDSSVTDLGESFPREDGREKNAGLVC